MTKQSFVCQIYIEVTTTLVKVKQGLDSPVKVTVYHMCPLTVKVSNLLLWTFVGVYVS